MCRVYQMKTFSGWIHAVMKKARITKIQNPLTGIVYREKNLQCTFICIHLHTDTPVQYL